MTLALAIDRARCTGCGECAADCPARILTLETGVPSLAPDGEGKCYRCLHCLAVCPTGAVSILGRNPDDETELLPGALPSPAAMETLMRGRRSVRRYRDENLPAELMTRLVWVASHAPTGVNARGVRFTLIDERAEMAAFRERTYAALDRILPAAVEAGGDDRAGFYRKLVDLKKEKGVDSLFRGAPHFLVATAPADCATPEADCLIALAYFELYARVSGVGCVWNGMMRHILDGYAPELKATLGIPEGHRLGYCMSFGPPAVEHRRTVRRDPFEVHRPRIAAGAPSRG